MDQVDDRAEGYVALTRLDCTAADRGLLDTLATSYLDVPVAFMRVDRGRSTALKVIMKPAKLFPILVKLDDTSQIDAERRGDELLRQRLPPLSVPPLVGYVANGPRAAIAYRYITGGRVRHVVPRLDTWFAEARPEELLRFPSEVFDVVLKKCHWDDGDVIVKIYELPELPPEGMKDSYGTRAAEAYGQLKAISASVRAPFGVVHGDLHSKNILVPRHGMPVLIDFAKAASNAVIYLDYAKFEAYLPFQVPANVSEAFWHVNSRLYSTQPLILPRADAPLAAVIHGVRSLLWKNCLSRTVGLSHDEIDFGYRGCLGWLLARFLRAPGRDETTRVRALEQLEALVLPREPPPR